MSSITQFLTDQRLVESFDVDLKGRLRPQTLLALLLNSAWNHTRGTSYGYEELTTRNMMWVLIKVLMRITRPPRWGEQITIETWSKRIEWLYALRDFAVTTANGDKLVSATSCWMVLDRSSGRPQRFDPGTDGLPSQPGREELETSLDRVLQLSDGKELAQFPVLVSDIDVNHHVNSTKYLQWMIDSHSVQYLEPTEPASIELSYLSEAFPDDRVSIFSQQCGSQEFCCVRRSSDGKDLCRARFEWRKSAQHDAVLLASERP